MYCGGLHTLRINAMRKPRNTRGSSADPLRIDVTVTVKKGFSMSLAAQESAILQWRETGKAPRGYAISAVEWTNPARKKPALRKPRTATTDDEIEEARATLGKFLGRSRFHKV